MKEDNELLRQFLLGQLSHNEQSWIEEELLFDVDYMELLLVIEDEIIESHAGGALPAPERKGLEENFFCASERIRKFGFAKILENDNSTTQVEVPGFLNHSRRLFLLWRPSHIFVSAVGILLLTAAGVAVWWALFHQTELDSGMVALNATYCDERPFKPRISGLYYSQFLEPRGDEMKNVKKLALTRAERIFLGLIEARPKPDSFHALGRYSLTKKDLPQAVGQYEIALETGPKTAELNNYFCADLPEQVRADRLNGVSCKRLGDLAKALDNFDKAHKLNSGLLEQLFNRVLCRQSMTLLRQAEADFFPVTVFIIKSERTTLVTL